MKLIEILNQHRRDYDGKYQCEGCGHIETHYGCYDDRNFHDNVTPRWECPECKKTTLDIKGKADYVPTKYSDWETV